MEDIYWLSLLDNWYLPNTYRAKWDYSISTEVERNRVVEIDSKSVIKVTLQQCL